MKILVDFMVIKQAKFTDEDIAEVDKQYATFTYSIEQNKVANKGDVEKQNKTLLYNMFYDRLVTESASIKSIIRDVKSTKKLSENNYTLLDASYTNAVTVYNVWVQ
jgi:gamma-glutamyl phosphate reductase